MASICPVAKTECQDVASPQERSQWRHEPALETREGSSPESADSLSRKCPFGYDSRTFKLGPLSCLICQALLYESSRCLPCSHVYCKACISRFKDCLLCGADIESIEDDKVLQRTVDQFIEGHGRIKRCHFDQCSADIAVRGKETLIYEDVSQKRGDFLVQQAVRAFRANNFESSKSRLGLCVEDITAQLEELGNTSELCIQLGVVLGMLGDCCRALGDSGAAVKYFEESVSFIRKFPSDDQEISHSLSVSLNKIGDLKYHDCDLEGAKSYYLQSLNVRRKAMGCHPDVSSLPVDLAISLAKVADIDRNVGNEDSAINGFMEAINMLESLTLSSEEVQLEQKRKPVYDFLKSQIGFEKSGNATAGSNPG